jgi:hypothetical protein
MTSPLPLRTPGKYEGQHFNELLKHFGIFSETESESEQMTALDFFLETRRADLEVQEEVRSFCLALAKVCHSLQDSTEPVWKGIAAIAQGQTRVVMFMQLLSSAWT